MIKYLSLLAFLGAMIALYFLVPRIKLRSFLLLAYWQVLF